MRPRARRATKGRAARLRPITGSGAGTGNGSHPVAIGSGGDIPLARDEDPDAHYSARHRLPGLASEPRLVGAGGEAGPTEGDAGPAGSEARPAAGRSEEPPATVREAIAVERARIARELHDSVDKSLHGIALAAASLAAQHGADPESSRQRLRELAGLARYTISETRCVIYDLRDDNVNSALGGVVRNVATVWGRSTGIAVSLAVPPDADAGNEYRREIVAILREALRNVEMHAHAARVHVSVRRAAERLLLTVADNGHGFPFPADPRELQAAGHYGLVGMTERARKLGGTLVIRSRPGHGTRIAVQVPAADADTAG
jgi:signal transduction histidine kinase